MDNQISKQLRAERVERLTEVETELRHTYYHSLVGKKLQLMAESESPLATIGTESPTNMVLKGTTCRYAPAEVVTTDSSVGEGSMVDIQVTSTDGERLIGKLA